LIEIESKDKHIDTAHSMLKYFFHNFEQIYSNSKCNVHTMTWHLIKDHLIEDVERHGSLAFRSMFYTESFLGYLSSRGLRGGQASYCQTFFFKIHFFLMFFWIFSCFNNKKFSKN
jgi:hypothetical protein